MPAGVAGFAVSLLSGFRGKVSKKDKDRAAEAARDLARAIANDLPSARDVVHLKDHAATDYAKAAYRDAWAKLQVANPAIARQVAIEEGEAPPPEREPSTGQIIRQEFQENVVKPAQSGFADFVQRVLTGAGAKAGNKLRPPGSPERVSIPTDTRSLVIVGLVVIVALFAVYHFGFKKR